MKVKAVRCEAMVALQGGVSQQCNVKVSFALQAIKCRCDRFHCTKHFDVVAHNCPDKTDKTRGVAKRRFFTGESDGHKDFS